MNYLARAFGHLYAKASLKRAFCLILVLLSGFGWQQAYAQITGYPPISAKKAGQLNPHSPDPIFNYTWAGPKATDGLESYTLSPVSWSVSNPHSFNMSGFKKTGTIVVNGKGDIRFDFGQTNAALLEFDSPDLQDSVQMSISEYNQPPNYSSNYPPKTLSPKKHGNTYRLELNPDLYEGVRFGWIHMRSFSKTWHITAVRLVCQVRPTNYKGSFSCSDTLLTRIWYTGAYTVKLNLLKDYLGAILMNRGDRFSWTGDAHPAQAASMVAFANYDFVKKNIDYTSGQSNGIRSYALYWVLSLVDYYKYTGDSLTLKKYTDNACAKLDDAYKVYDTNPNLEYYGWDERLGAGFEHPNLPEPQNAYKMLSIRAWKEFAAAMAACGRADLQDKYNKYATEEMANLKKDAAWYKDFGLHAGADAVTTGLLNIDEKKAIYAKSFTDKVNRISYSPFNEYFVIQAFALMNKYDDALISIRDLWGGQIKYGGTTFFEDYRPSWNAMVGTNGPVPTNQCGFTSLCHPWGAGVTKWLSEEVLGIKPTSPGFTTFNILPHLGRTLTYVSGKTHTLYGDISADFNVATGICSISVPTGTIGRIGIPKVEKNIRSIKVNGVLLWDGRYHPIDSFGGASEDADFVYLTGAQPGKYKFVVDYNGATPKYIEPFASYAAKYISMDSKTGGNWGGIYGKDGYVLCNYNGDGKDKTALPPYVTSVNYYKVKGNGLPLNLTNASKTNDRRALAPDPTNGYPRTAAGLYAMDGDQIGYTFTSTIAVKGEHNYRVSLYFLDWDNTTKPIEVEMFDAETSNIIAPAKMIKSCTGGVYLTYAYNGPVKFRINMSPNSKAVLSGIFFDKDK
ncbi:Bacterial alpha-L-rhamnosidase [Mucilaginibacter corticis]|uniref:Bacterial alpha-L-rhamnosidase n=1 Tax=Mucilaginibacter corticis TaxID=2597670 RepID=A0A556MW51_9SPHI|nr:alpha-L-rhamnosidase C-terminal domain-containing protein [Mucilaginibacter corticis]TSJ44095.1 Bacterial alpha-L-rhamnosidase [Mucilaginibacter corticis]